MSDSLSPLQLELARALRERRALPQSAAWSAFANDELCGSSRLSPVEQLEIYREQFWLRHTSSLVEDFPGLGGILGQADWEKLVEQYLSQIAPDSYTLRDLGARLPEVISSSHWLPHRELCEDMARLELAYIEVFDALDVPPLAPERLATIPEDALGDAKLKLAPAVRLLKVRYPVADLRRRLRKEGDEAVAIPEESPQNLVIYRRELRLWDMPLGAVAFELLSALGAGMALGAAAERAASSAEAEAELTRGLASWLAEWTGKGLISDISL